MILYQPLLNLVTHILKTMHDCLKNIRNIDCHQIIHHIHPPVAQHRNISLRPLNLLSQCILVSLVLSRGTKPSLFILFLPVLIRAIGHSFVWSELLQLLHGIQDLAFFLIFILRHYFCTYNIARLSVEVVL